MTKPKVIITGASGFVGANLIQYINQNNFDVQGVSLRDNNKILYQEKAIALIHLAGKAHDTKKTSQDSEYFKINTELTINVFDKFLESNIRDFFFFSSVKAAADEVKGILEETNIPNPITAYGKSKQEAEKYILSKELPEDKRVFIIRPCMIHGPGNKGNLNLLYKVISKGIPYPLAAFNNERSFLSVDNLNYLILQMLQDEQVKSGIYNFADDSFVSTNQLIEIISMGIGKQARLFKIPKALVQAVAKIGDVLKWPLNTERLTKLTENYRVSNHKIKAALGITKLPISAEQGLLITIKSFTNK